MNGSLEEVNVYVHTYVQMCIRTYIHTYVHTVDVSRQKGD